MARSETGPAWLILPTYNEAENVEPFVAAARAKLPAYVAGFRRALAAGGGLVLEMDSDFSHDPAYLPRLLEASRRADLVLGSRYVPGGGVSDWGPLRRAISRGGSAYARLLLGVEVRDLTGGFKCFRREVLEAIDTQIRLIARRAFGFHSPEALIALAMLSLGGLCPDLPGRTQ